MNSYNDSSQNLVEALNIHSIDCVESATWDDGLKSTRLLKELPPILNKWLEDFSN